MNDTKPITKIIAYYRLSRTKKGKNTYETIRDAYGLEDQRQEVARLAAQYGAKIIGEFTEVVSGKKLHREQLNKAISMARLHKATIVNWRGTPPSS
jgi:DNA invertase Pin-like site-specific DNA recombinase